jgi:hypothetical protein
MTWWRVAMPAASSTVSVVSSGGSDLPWSGNGRTPALSVLHPFPS